MQNITSQNETIYLKNLILSNINTSWLADLLYLCLILPLAIFGTIFNLTSLIIFSRKSFSEITLFKYLKCYAFISFLISFTQIFYFYFSPNILFDLALSYPGRVYRCYVANTVIEFLFFYGNVLDIFINIERALNFTNKYASFKSISSYVVCLGALLVCVLVNLPNDMAAEITPTEMLHTKPVICQVSSYVMNWYGKMLLIVSYVIQGPVVFILVMLTNYLSFKSYQKFMIRKTHTVHSSLPPQMRPVTAAEKKRKEKLEKTDMKLLFMTFYLAIFSILIHFIQFSSQILMVFFSSTNRTIVGWSVFLYSFITAFKHFSCIFFYYYFNRNFRRSFYFWREQKKNN